MKAPEREKDNSYNGESLFGLSGEFETAWEL